MATSVAKQPSRALVDACQDGRAKRREAMRLVDDAVMLDRLAAAHDQLLDGAALDPVLARLAATAIAIVLEQRERAAMVALRRDSRRQRDQLICRLAAEHFAGEPSVRAKAEAVLAAARRYFGTSWPRDRVSAVMPERLVDTQQEILWLIFKSARFLWSRRAIEAVLRVNE